MTPEDESRERGQEAGDHVGELLDAYRTDELDASDRASVEAHLDRCARCRDDLAALGPWTSSVGRGYAAMRSGARELEPDWAAQRAAIVARTSGKRRAGGEAWSFRRWAPQVALVAVAALIVGVVWRERARGPGDGRPATWSERADDDASGALRETPSPDLPAPTVAEPGAPPPAAVPRAGREAVDERVLEEKAEARGKEAALEAEQDRVGRQEALADRAAEPSLAAPVAEGAERFERDARAALAARDTTAARRALTLWSDTLAPAGADRANAALADSLERFLGTPE
ncbi:MAG TPA: zf-HC2 domain-containing protein [Gemmatimonadota bacterium]|jgi:hypothetical protein